jgi:hypothetical protein
VVTEIMEGQLTVKDGVERGLQLWDQGRTEFERVHGRPAG